MNYLATSSELIEKSNDREYQGQKMVCKINDARISGYTNRLRSGSKQVFYTGNDHRDWDRYRADDGPRKHNIKMHDKPDTIYLDPPEKHYFAELIDGEWWWINGCEECNGRNRDCFKSYIECDEHNVCKSCKTPAANIEGTRWGSQRGWQCDKCKATQHEAEKQAALEAMPKEFFAWDFHGLDNVTCPYCDFEFSDSFEHANADEKKQLCPRCDHTFKITALHILQFDCDRL